MSRCGYVGPFPAHRVDRPGDGGQRRHDPRDLASGPYPARAGHPCHPRPCRSRTPRRSKLSDPRRQDTRSPGHRHLRSADLRGPRGAGGPDPGWRGGPVCGFYDRVAEPPGTGPAGLRIDRTLGHLGKGAIVYLPLTLPAVSLDIWNDRTRGAAFVTRTARDDVPSSRRRRWSARRPIPGAKLASSAQCAPLASVRPGRPAPVQRSFCVASFSVRSAQRAGFRK